MSNQNMIQLIMIVILLLCGYIYLFQAVAKATANKSALPVIALILLIIYVMIAVPLVIIIRQMGSTELILISLLLLITCMTVFFAFYGLLRNYRAIRYGMLALFVLYVLAVAYITIFSRNARNSDTSIRMFRFDLVEQAIRTRSLQPINHLILNVAMFVPMGFLFPFILPEKLDRLSYSLLIGLSFTTVIEATQMMLRLGQADFTDMVTNTLGALVGYALYKIVHRFRHEEDDD